MNTGTIYHPRLSQITQLGPVFPELELWNQNKGQFPSLLSESQEQALRPDLKLLPCAKATRLSCQASVRKCLDPMIYSPYDCKFFSFTLFSLVNIWAFN